MAWGNIWGALVPLFQGEVDLVETRILEGHAAADEQGFAYVTALARMIEGWLEGKRGDPILGAAHIEEGLAAFCSTGAEIFLPFFQTLRAEMLVEAGTPEIALKILDGANAQILRWGERWQEPEVHRVLGRAHAANGDQQAAEEALRRACELADAAGAKAWHLRAANDLASMLEQQGRHADACEALLPLAPHFDGMRPSPDVDAAEDILRVDVQSDAPPSRPPVVSGAVSKTG